MPFILDHQPSSCCHLSSSNPSSKLTSTSTSASHIMKPTTGFLKFFGKKPNKNTNTSSRTLSIASTMAESPSSSKSAYSYPPQTNSESSNYPTNVSAPTYTSAPPHDPELASSSSDIPPAYTDPIATTNDDPYANLANFDTVFVIDDSGSMAGQSWRETSQALKAIVPICASRDVDGVDLHFLNHPHKFTNLKRAASVHEIFQTVQPRGGTPTGTCLHRILKAYMKEIAAKGDPEKVRPMNIIVITDGVPSDDVGSVIIDAAKKLFKWEAPAWQVGIQFFQVGRESGAAEALKELDDDLANEKDVRDMVDTVSWHTMKNGLSAADMLKVTLGAVNRKLDRRN